MCSRIFTVGFCKSLVSRSPPRPASPAIFNLKPPISNWYSKSSKENDGGEKARDKERAPSTAQEFNRVAAEKLKEADQGVASQTVDKIPDAVAEALSDDSDLDSVKNEFKKHDGGADYHREK